MKKPELRSVDSDLPDPPYREKIRANGYRLDLDVGALKESDNWEIAPAEIRPWITHAFVISWVQNICGSLPGEDDLLAAKLGCSPDWLRLYRDRIMHEWYLCSNGRLYHPEITDQVERMLETRGGWAKRQKRRRQKKQDVSENVTRDSRGSHGGVTGESRPLPLTSYSYSSTSTSTSTSTSDKNPQTPKGGHAPETPIDEAHQDLAPAEPQPTKSAKHRKPRKPRASFVVPSTDDVAEYCRDRGNSIDPNAFVDHYESKGWVVGKSPMRDWKAAVRTWERNGYQTGNGGRSNGKGTGAAPKVFVPDYGVESDANVIEGEFIREVG